MTYDEFREAVGPLDALADKDFILREDSIHYVIALGAVFPDNTYKIVTSSDAYAKFLKIVDLVNSRGGVRGQDYFIRSYVRNNKIETILHTTSQFLSSEDV